MRHILEHFFPLLILGIKFASFTCLFQIRSVSKHRHNDYSTWTLVKESLFMKKKNQIILTSCKSGWWYHVSGSHQLIPAAHYVTHHGLKWTDWQTVREASCLSVHHMSSAFSDTGSYPGPQTHACESIFHHRLKGALRQLVATAEVTCSVRDKCNGW